MVKLPGSVKKVGSNSLGAGLMGRGVAGTPTSRERAGASIGTVYRYFPDRIVLLQALGSRNFERVMARITEAIKDPAHADWRGALSTAFASVIDTYRKLVSK